MEGVRIPRMGVPELEDRFPWLKAGTTRRRPGVQQPNFGLFTALPAGEAMAAWQALREDLGASGVAHAHQVHGSRVLVHDGPGDGLHVVGEADGHATRTVGLLATVTVADCVPVFLVDPTNRAVALLHAGWRGAAAGMLEAGVATLASSFGSLPAELHVHLGPSICGSCYEVGPEVFEALGLERGRLLDLREALARRATETGIPVGRVSVSDECTACRPDLFSHRGGDQGRQVAYMMISSEVASS